MEVTPYFPQRAETLGIPASAELAYLEREYHFDRKRGCARIPSGSQAEADALAAIDQAWETDRESLQDTTETRARRSRTWWSKAGRART